jgi:hypothetical protein
MFDTHYAAHPITGLVGLIDAHKKARLNGRAFLLFEIKARF